MFSVAAPRGVRDVRAGRPSAGIPVTGRLTPGSKGKQAGRTLSEPASTATVTMGAIR